MIFGNAISQFILRLKTENDATKLVSDDSRYVVIRHLYCVADLAQFAVDRNYPSFLKSLRIAAEFKRSEIKAMISDWEKQYPGRVDNLFRGLQNVVPSHLMDNKLNSFDSPNPEELLTYRRDNPLNSDASEIRELLAEAELNPWVQMPNVGSQPIELNGYSNDNQKPLRRNKGSR